MGGASLTGGGRGSLMAEPVSRAETVSRAEGGVVSMAVAVYRAVGGLARNVSRLFRKFKNKNNE